MKLVVGLGNPGGRYQGTRHNVGFDVVDYLASGPGCGPFRSRFKAAVAEMNENGQTILLVKPETFMNLSGESVRQAVDFYKVGPADLLVVCDDLSLPLGKLRARAKGSAGGHNGLKNIEAHLGTQDYSRLRVGIGGPGEDVVDHVLSKFKPSERAAAQDAVAEAARAVLLWAAQGIEVCMNRINGGTEPKERKKPRPAAGDAGTTPS
jgi:PTH1 family peptidyl-tRNA hydrolase